MENLRLGLCNWGYNITSVTLCISSRPSDELMPFWNVCNSQVLPVLLLKYKFLSTVCSVSYQRDIYVLDYARGQTRLSAISKWLETMEDTQAAEIQFTHAVSVLVFPNIWVPGFPTVATLLWVCNNLVKECLVIRIAIWFSTTAIQPT